MTMLNDEITEAIRQERESGKTLDRITKVQTPGAPETNHGVTFGLMFIVILGSVFVLAPVVIGIALGN